ncbi:MAG: 7-carboxy-7-deazaguanine synthase QueE [Candidatus Omnitrophica bacterium]|nr:7-carboxy-7-deazaguanine synthase QueE [Candidatus Omnitrophota bacterium]
MKTAQISEIFQSIQGEGKYVGVRQVFVRFFGCHMHCSWCDTPESIGDTTRNYQEMTLAEVFAKIKELSVDCHSISLTGGEPLLQADFIANLLPLLKKAKLSVYLETSGVLHKALNQVIKGVDIVAMDIKMPSSTGERSFWKEHEQFLNIARKNKKDIFVKAVVGSKTSKADIVRTAKIVHASDPNMLFILQPNTFDLSRGVVQKCEDFQRLCFKILPNTRVMPQMHKFMKIR